MWVAGGGIKGGTIHGATDEYGYYAVENKVTVHDLHATALHLLGLDHTRLTFPFGGREMRLTDVHGVVVKEILSSGIIWTSVSSSSQPPTYASFWPPLPLN